MNAYLCNYLYQNNLLDTYSFGFIMKTLTVFTPAYNRAHLLPRLYESLKRQSSQDFIWMIADDGSQDDTRQQVEKWQQEQKIDMVYLYQENQGMHGAHNLAYAHITTELNTCIDSDDFMPDNAVELILNKWKTVSHKEKFAGLAGLDADLDGKLIGTPFTTAETTIEEFYRKGGKGDKKLVYRTIVMQQYPPYPLFEGEKYVGLSYKYLLADQDYPLITLNEVLVIVDYQQGGSSNNMVRQYYKNPKGFAFFRKEQMKLSKSSKRIWMDAVHYVSSSFLAGNKNFVQESPKKFQTIVAIPLGFMLSLYIRFKNRKTSASKEL